MTWQRVYSGHVSRPSNSIPDRKSRQPLRQFFGGAAMRVYPDMHVRFPEGKEAELIEAMKAKAKAPWEWQPAAASGLRPDEGCVCFHRSAVKRDPACALFLHPKGPGHLVVVNIV